MIRFYKSLSMLVIVLAVFTQAMAQQTNPAKEGSSANRYKWNMFGLNRVHIQDFGLTDQYAENGNASGLNGFLGKANTTVGFSFYNNFSEHFAFSTDFGVGNGYISRNNATASDFQKGWSSSLRGDLYYNFADSRLSAQPFLFTGLQGNLRKGNAFFSMPIGLGARYMVMNNGGMIIAQVGYGLGLTQRMRNNITYSWGVYLDLKRKKNGSAYTDDAMNDTDKDGIIDSQDKCPNEFGLVSNNGCPINDKDNDGVADEKDKCPNEFGSVDNNGCPIIDRDKDGVGDLFDKCPELPGPVSNDGCPLSDRDKDGIDDKNDKCPDLAGTPQNMGCPLTDPNAKQPVQVNNDPIWIADGNHFKSITGDSLKYVIYFEFDRYKLTKESVTLLDEVNKYLRNNLNWECSMEGHSDLEGDLDYNLKLSIKRAKMAKQQLMNYGIRSNKISTNGFGKTRPVVSTFQEDLGWMNRRVEAILVRKK
jgi:outer membrane protein OmpA-like peptidoglycan-associated protein